MKIKDFREKWFKSTPKERIARFNELADEFDSIRPKFKEEWSKSGKAKDYDLDYDIWKKEGIWLTCTNKGRELLALQSLCKCDCLGSVDCYDDKEWITKKFSGSWGETPTEAYFNVREFLGGIKGVEVTGKGEDDRSNSHIHLSVYTRYYVYSYETRYSSSCDGYVVYLICTGRDKRKPSEKEWLNYIGRKTMIDEDDLYKPGERARGYFW